MQGSVIAEPILPTDVVGEANGTSALLATIASTDAGNAAIGTPAPAPVRRPLVPGQVQIGLTGGETFNDNGLGQWIRASDDAVVGAINYFTGAWTIVLTGADAGKAITSTYKYFARSFSFRHRTAHVGVTLQLIAEKAEQDTAYVLRARNGAESTPRAVSAGIIKAGGIYVAGPWADEYVDIMVNGPGIRVEGDAINRG